MPRRLPWFKVHVNLFDDPIFYRVPERARLHYFYLYKLALDAQAGGLIAANDEMLSVEEIAFLVRVEPAVLTASLDALERAGLVTRHGNGCGSGIVRFLDEQGPERPANKRDEWLFDQFSTRQRILGEPIPDDFMQEKERKNQKQIQEGEAEENASPTYENGDDKRLETHPINGKSEIATSPDLIYESLTGLRPNKHQRKGILATVTDPDIWQAVIDYWLMNDWKKTNVAGMLDMYEKGGPPKQHRSRQNDLPIDQQYRIIK